MSLLEEGEINVEEDETGVPVDSAALLREALRGSPRQAVTLSAQETGSEAPETTAAPAPAAAPAAVPTADEPVAAAAAPSPESPARARPPSPEMPASPELHAEDEQDVEGTTEDTAAASKKEHRHRWVLKHGPGPKLGLTLSTHPALPDVYVVSDLKVDGACALNGVRVGDLINKVNGETMPTVQAAIQRIDEIWSHEAEDPAKDRLKLSLADRTRDVHIVARPPEPLGMTLTSSDAQYGVAVVSVDAGSPAAAAGLEKGHVIFAVNGKLAQSHAQALKEMNHQRAAAGVASMLVSGHKLTEGNLEYVQLAARLSQIEHA